MNLHCDGPMRETYSKRKRKGKEMYRYYLCGTDVKRNHSDCPLKRIAAEPLEELLMERVSALLSTPEALAGILTQAALLSPDSPLRRGNLPEKFVDLAQVWDFMYPIEKQKFIRTIVREVRGYVDKAVFKYNLRGLEDVVKELPDGRRSGDAITAAMESEPKPGRLVACPDGDFEETIPIRSKYDGRRTILIQPDSASLVLDPEELSPLQKAVLQGLHYSDLMETSQAKSLTELAEQLDVERTFLYHSLELVNLAPDIISAILKGEIPAELKLKNLRGNLQSAILLPPPRVSTLDYKNIGKNGAVSLDTTHSLEQVSVSNFRDYPEIFKQKKRFRNGKFAMRHYLYLVSNFRDYPETFK